MVKILKTVNLRGLGKKYQGKVRDFYIKDGRRIIITTDRQSAFDVNLGYIPYKGAVLNLLASWWFDKTQKIVQNHKISVPHQNVLIAKSCQVIPVEMIVRGYISGVTTTSPWYSYNRGDRVIYGMKFPDGLKKNQRLPEPIITPTTHPDPSTSSGQGPVHDERLTRQEILKRKIVPKKLYEEMERVSIRLFKFGQKLCAKKGLILVDTKYEFGLHNGKLTLIDEIHTPDSSRFWIKKTYTPRFKKGLEPENFDKEFLRLWYAKRGYIGKGKPPKMSPKLVSDLSKRYIQVYEKIAGRKFKKVSPDLKSLF